MIFDRPAEPGKKYALTFTIAVHLGLVAALFLGVQWKRSQPEVMEVELWSTRPQPATYVPPPPPPPEVKPEPPKPVAKPEPKPEPPPKKPDIVIKAEKKPPKPEPKKPEPKPEPKKPEPKPEPKKPEAKPEAKPLPKVDPFKEMLEREDRQRKASENQDRLKAQADIEQRASSDRRGLADYAAKIRGKVKGNIVLPPGIQGNPEANFSVNQLPSGEILSVKLKQSTGNPGLDAAIERAILKSSPLPKPDNPAIFERNLVIKYKPFEE